MLPTTLKVLRATLETDPSINVAERRRLLQLIRQPADGQQFTAVTPSEPRLVRRAEAARRLGCSLRLVDRLAKDGSLPKRRLPNRQRAAGFLETDLLALIAGRAAV